MHTLLEQQAPAASIVCAIFETQTHKSSYANKTDRHALNRIVRVSTNLADTISGFRNYQRLLAPTTQVPNDDSVTLLDHLVQKELVTLLSHLTSNAREVTEPSIGHFCGRGVESPATILDEVLEPRGVAVFLAELVRIFML